MPRDTAEDIRVATLVATRWTAVVGQAVTLLVVQLALGTPASLAPAWGMVAALALFNLMLMAGGGARRRVHPEVAAAHLAFDVLQLVGLIALTGGLANPFVIFTLAPVTVAAATLSARHTALLALLAVAALTGAANWHRPLPWPEGNFAMPPLYTLGVWCALVLSTGFAAAYTWWMAGEARSTAGALAAAQVALADERRVAAVGALAAAVAHEMSTPLGTIALVVADIAADLPAGSPLAEDIGLLKSQSDRCRAILSQLAKRRDADNSGAITRLPVATLVEMAAEPHRRDDRVAMVFEAGGDGTAPWLLPSPEIMHGLGNYLQNALQFAASRVAVATRWDDRAVTVTVADDGPGFPPHILARLGDPYLSTRRGDGLHMGLGVFIAGTLLHGTGASVAFANQESGGARVTVRWPRATLGEARADPL